MQQIAITIIRILASRGFFYVVLGFFLFEALWIACSAVYPMAFDEGFHYGVIQLFSEHGSPFLSSQPVSADGFSAIIRDPSILYHWLMVIPYRLVGLFTDNQTAIVLVLRFLNIALFTWSLVLFRRLLLRAKLSAAFAHTALAIFVLIPIVPQLAAHINYDNLLMLAVPVIGLLAARVLDGFEKKKVDVTAILLLVLVCMASSLVKYESLPIVTAVLAFIGFRFYRTFRNRRLAWQKTAQAWKHVPRRTALILLGVFVLLLGVMVQRYGVNAWQYQTLKPECDAVLNETRCQAFGPWARNHSMAQTKPDVDTNPLYYTQRWVDGLHRRLMFAISGPTNSYYNYPGLPLPAIGMWALAFISLLVLVVYGRRIFAQNRLLSLFFIMSVLYLVALWFNTYFQFLQTGRVVAVNGRYLLPILLPLAGVVGYGLSMALRSKPVLKASLAAVAIACFLHGGGVFTFIARSDDKWYWQNTFIVEMNHRAQDILKPVLIEGDKQY
jgi:hypothetical protein